jgi:hypothetical protein
MFIKSSEFVCVGVDSEKCKYIYVHIQGLRTIPVSVFMTLGFGIWRRLRKGVYVKISFVVKIVALFEKEYNY